jgi:hypothetical protein
MMAFYLLISDMFFLGALVGVGVGIAVFGDHDEPTWRDPCALRGPYD